MPEQNYLTRDLLKIKAETIDSVKNNILFFDDEAETLKNSLLNILEKGLKPSYARKTINMAIIRKMY